MKIFITRINKRNPSDMFLYKYVGNKKEISACIWFELLEPRYVLNKEAFLIAWRQFMDCSLDIVIDERFKADVLCEYLTYFHSSKLEAFLERVWGNSRFSMLVK